MSKFLSRTMKHFNTDYGNNYTMSILRSLNFTLKTKLHTMYISVKSIKKEINVLNVVNIVPK